MSFQNLKITEPILQALVKQGYTMPTPIQEAAIPPLLEGRDLLGCAQTGTGKTAAFAIPIIQRLSLEKSAVKGPRHIKALILTPTRELAVQIDNSFSAYGRFAGLKHTVIYGGVSQNPQIQTLQFGVDVLVATPGRLIDLMNQKFVDLSHIGYFVLDEADRMLDMGFLRDLEKIIPVLPTNRQTMLFSATMPPEIEALTKTILKDPVKVAVAPVSSTSNDIEQVVYHVNKTNKTKLLIHLLKDSEIVSALVFTRTKHGANQLTEALRAAGESCEVIHANKSQSIRLRALEKFKSGKARVLVATDIVARGIDIAELSHVINFNIPESPEDYVHRIGRTGRAGLTGTAISFCDSLEKRSLASIEKLIGKTIPVVAEHPFPLDETKESELFRATERTQAHKRWQHHNARSKGGSRSASRPYKAK
ncbi:DEAD/DEAH box helicase [Oscillospiraceae bacterium CM]|nr:DEAD/DEAH box helicase [Oscillospiraceae bacterium CM]